MKISIQIFLRVLLGGVFLFSAYSKLFPIEPFELLLLQQGITSWEIAPYFSRLLIAFETILGVYILLGLFPKMVLRSTLAVLVVFTGYIIYILVIEGPNADCGCMGDFVKLTPFESIAKNLILIGLTFILEKWGNYSFPYFPSLVTIALCFLILPMPFILNPPDSFFASENSNEVYKVDTSLLSEVEINGKKITETHGPYIIALLSLECPHCQVAASKLTLIKKDMANMPPVYFVVAGDAKGIAPFYEKTKAPFPHYHMQDPRAFIKLTKGSFPTLLLMDSTYVLKKLNNFELTPEAFKKALSK